MISTLIFGILSFLIGICVIVLLFFSKDDIFVKISKILLSVMLIILSYFVLNNYIKEKFERNIPKEMLIYVNDTVIYQKDTDINFITGIEELDSLHTTDKIVIEIKLKEN